jgi:fatty-acyl-CoA synthase
MASFHELAACTAPLPDTPLQSTDLLQIVYTSGTESRPRAPC